MVRCKRCGVPLTGFLSCIPRILFGVKASDSQELCNKCVGRDDAKTYTCQICGRQVHEKHSLEHVKAEEYLIGLIRKDHTHWHQRQPTCEECIAYYRQLIQKTEI